MKVIKKSLNGTAARERIIQNQAVLAARLNLFFGTLGNLEEQKEQKS